MHHYMRIMYIMLNTRRPDPPAQTR